MPQIYKFTDFHHFLGYITVCPFVALAKAYNMPKLCTLFCLVQIKSIPLACFDLGFFKLDSIKHLVSQRETNALTASPSLPCMQYRVSYAILTDTFVQVTTRPVH